MTADAIYAKSELDDDLMKEARAWRERNGAECDGYVKALLCGKPQKLLLPGHILLRARRRKGVFVFVRAVCHRALPY